MRFTPRIRVAAALAALTATYAALGFGVAPRLLRSQATAFVREHHARELHLGAVRVNPFLLRLEIDDAALPDAGGGPLLGFRRLVVDLELSSIWQRALVFREITLEAPTVNAVIREDGALNLADLAPRPDPSRPPEPDAPPPSLWIQQLSVSGGAARFEDRHREEPLERTFADVGFSLQDFRTTPEGGDFRFRAVIQGDGSLEWSGRFALAPVLSAEGSFQLAGLRAPGLAELAGDAVPFAVTSGKLDVGGTYRVALGETPQVELQLPRVALSELALRPRGGDEDLVRLPSLVVSGTTLSLASRSVKVDGVHLDHLEIHAAREPDGDLDLQRLLGPPATPEAAPTPPPPATPTASPASSVPWSLALALLELKDARLELVDRTLPTPGELVLAPVNLRVQHASLDLTRPVVVALHVGIGEGAIDLEGAVTPQPLEVALDLHLSKLPLPALQPWIGESAALTITRGTVDVAGAVKLSGGALDLRADVDVRDLESVDDALRERLVGLRHLRLAGLHHAPGELTIERVALRRPYARVVIAQDGTLNLASVRRPPRGPPAPPGDPLTIRVGQVRVDGGQLSFTDRLVRGGFAAELADLSGTITSVSSSARARTRLDLKGHVDDAPVAVKGEVAPFDHARFTDVSLSLANLELPIFNPYSGPVAGYNIARGKLGTEIHYRIERGRLAAEHAVRVDGLEWGEATDSRGAATLPVRFATSLLKDRNGVIALELPVEGTLDDPSFRIGPVVWQVLKNLLVKAATAPFAALGAAFAGAQDAQFVDFAPGSAELPPGAASSLAALAKGLVERPSLGLDVPIGSVAELDRAALVERALEASLASAPASPAGRIAALNALVKRRTGREPQVPEAAAASGRNDAGPGPRPARRRRPRLPGEGRPLRDLRAGRGPRVPGPGEGPGDQPRDPRLGRRPRPRVPRARGQGLRGGRSGALRAGSEVAASVVHRGPCASSASAAAPRASTSRCS